MSRIGAMVNYTLGKVEAAVQGVHVSRIERPIVEILNEMLPYCQAYDVSGDISPGDFKQREEVTSISLLYVNRYDIETHDSLLETLQVKQDIEKEIWDGNVIDTDAAGFFAYMSAFGEGRTEPKSDRHLLVMEVIFETMDMEDSASALVE